jgi:hypothetical protein
MQVTLTDAEIKSFLETTPLYSWREFRKPPVNRAGLGIKEIDAFCEICNQPRPFQDFKLRGSGAGMAGPALSSGTSCLDFECASCRKARRIFLIEQVVNDQVIRVQKFGELPRKRLPRDPGLQRFLAADLENYEKAVACLANSYGVAAFAYFRRITESNIGRLLELLQEDAAESGADSATVMALAELRNDSPMKDKIRVANLALPPYLKPDGLNPLGKLYKELSEGIHSLTDLECLERAKTLSACLEFLVGELASRKEHMSRFKSQVGRM